jgi:hypothetical protein
MKQQLSVPKNDAKRAELIKSLVGLTSNIDLQSGLVYARIGVAHSHKINNKKEQPVFYEMQGRIHANLIELNSVSFYFDKAMKGYTTIGNKKGRQLPCLKLDGCIKRKVKWKKPCKPILKHLS